LAALMFCIFFGCAVALFFAFVCFFMSVYSVEWQPYMNLDLTADKGEITVRDAWEGEHEVHTGELGWLNCFVALMFCMSQVCCGCLLICCLFLYICEWQPCMNLGLTADKGEITVRDAWEGEHEVHAGRLEFKLPQWISLYSACDGWLGLLRYSAVLSHLLGCTCIYL
jgi:hypothetical protein